MAEKHITSILVLIQDSWGELDWILPICYHIKNTQPRTEITVLFTKNKMRDVIKDNEILYDLLDCCADRCYDFNHFLPLSLRKLTGKFKSPDYGEGILVKASHYAQHKFLEILYQYYHTRIANKIIKLCEPDILLKDIAEDTDFRVKVTALAQANGSCVVAFPHGTEILSDQPWASPYGNRPCTADLTLCSTDNATELYSKMYNKNTKTVGHPRYDNFWIRFISKLKSKEPVGLTGKYVIALVTRGRHFQIISEDTLDYIMREALDVVFSYPDTYLIVKPHPRHSNRALEKYLEKYDRTRWRIDATALLCFGGIIDLTISPFSSSILDSLAIGVPVIEFFRFEGSNYKWSTDEDGNLATGYRQHKLVAPANTGEELRIWIEKFREEPEVTARPFLENFRKMFPQSEDSATVAAVDAIMNVRRI